MKFKNIEFLIGGKGDITIGPVGSISCVASAADDDQCLAMLVRRPNESLMELLRRLDGAIEVFFEREIFVDEVNDN